MAIVNHNRYGKNSRNKDNPHPSSYVRYSKDMEKVQRLNVSGDEEINYL